jgi:hypothetical protein
MLTWRDVLYITDFLENFSLYINFVKLVKSETIYSNVCVVFHQR